MVKVHSGHETSTFVKKERKTVGGGGGKWRPLHQKPPPPPLPSRNWFKPRQHPAQQREEGPQKHILEVIPPQKWTPAISCQVMPVHYHTLAGPHSLSTLIRMSRGLYMHSQIPCVCNCMWIHHACPCPSCPCPCPCHCHGLMNLIH